MKKKAFATPEEEAKHEARLAARKRQRELRKRERVQKSRAKMREANDTFGAALYNFRIRKGLTLRNIADELEYDESYISSIQNNRKPPFKKDKCKRLAEYLGLDEGEKRMFYSLAAKSLGDERPVPYDIEDYLYKHPTALDFLRIAQMANLDDSYWKGRINSYTLAHQTAEEVKG